MKTYQARPKWDLERSLRRRLLVETTLRVLGGFVVALLMWAFLFALIVIGS